jgi:predicted MFS family arabinose efflux permease
MARDVLGVGARGLGLLSAMAGVGQLLAMSALASLGDYARKGLLLTLSAFGFGLFILLFGLSPWFPLSLALVAVVGGMSSVYDSTMMTVMQLAVPTDMRGRVMGLYASTWGLNQVGGVSLGAIGALLSVPLALAISGGTCAAYALRLLPFTRRLDPPQQTSAQPDAPT